MNIKAWFFAMRPKTLPAAICPVILGLAYAWHAGGNVDWAIACLTMVCAVLIQIGTNYANDYFDHQKGADREDRLGPIRAIQSGLVTPEQMRKAFIGVFGLAFVLGIFLVLHGGWSILLVGMVSIACGILYTATPFALGYLGVADWFVFVFFGPLAVSGTVYLQTLQWMPEAAWLGVSSGLFSVAILTINNLRDIDQDRVAHKKTMAVRLGARWTKFQYNLAVNMACFVPFFIFRESKYLFVLLLLLPALKTKLIVWHQKGPALNKALAQTSLTHIAFTAMMVVAFLSI